MSEPIKPSITFPDWLKTDLRIVTIIDAKSIENADKLLHFTIDAGELGTHTVCSGVKEWYTPESFIGQQAIWLANLPPKSMRGVESEGMLLFSHNGEKYVPLRPTEKIPNGVQVE